VDKRGKMEPLEVKKEEKKGVGGKKKKNKRVQ